MDEPSGGRVTARGRNNCLPDGMFGGIDQCLFPLKRTQRSPEAGGPRTGRERGGQPYAVWAPHPPRGWREG